MRFPLILFGVASAVWLAPAATLDAQRAESPVVARSAESRRAAAETFLDRRRPEAERLAAAKLIGYPDEKTFAALLAVGADRSESDAIRWEALGKHRFDEKYLELVLKIITDPEDGGAELDASLIEDLNRRATFKLPVEIRQRIMAAWRQSLNDPRDRVRLAAFRVLVANHDPGAINVLAEGLRRGQNQPIPLHEAIELLDLDGPMNHVRALRPYLDHTDPRVLAEAARALAADPESRPRIVELARNRDSPQEVLLQALRGLAREDDQFAAYALPILENAQEDPEVRYGAMHSFAGRLNYSNVEPRMQIRFAEAVDKLVGERGLPGANVARIQADARELHDYLKQAFPEIQKHYERR